MIFTLALISLSAFFVNSYRSYAKIVDARLARGYLISRAGIYAAPRTLRPGQRLSPEALAAALRRAGYLDDENASEIWNGSFSIRNDAVEIRPNNSTLKTSRRCWFRQSLRLRIDASLITRA